MKVKRCADFNLKMHQKRLGPAEEFTALPRPSIWIYEVGYGQKM